MTITSSLDLEMLALACVRRSEYESFTLNSDRQRSLDALCRDSVVLVTGAAGFIAQSTLPHVLSTKPRKLYLLDSSENGLASLARKLATSQDPDHPTEIHLVLADMTSPLLDRAVNSMAQVDVVLHFAAVKHVRSERDSSSALRILDVNILGTQRLLQLLGKQESPPQIFAVSTDKAVNPASIMGASKLIMESLLWLYPGVSTSARFANVLFSSGSITESWIDRIGRGEPLSAPLNTYRYFVSPRQAGLICVNALVAPNHSIVIPRSEILSPVSLVALAHNFMEFFGKSAKDISLEEWQSVHGIGSLGLFSGNEYPLICTPRNTAGEKEVEEFSQLGEQLRSFTPELSRIVAGSSLQIDGLLARIKAWISDPVLTVTVGDIRTELATVIDGFSGDENSETLDSRI